ncbi:GNAT family N-acetyltransferase [Methylovirgula sp. 4M-Z18]|uniref:GNAT family N-acetyltransferase n=1 Tax=Methylovirgula sp. 4M-Z18 TaxID=2293567 RepID=UPI000E2F7CE5|nr:GNAT family N-acetyltransferase [Methylovirgula sp. 4M-Z18]RFB80600.1 N-acetyltransferase [Methylovirgula sp. 4M-Z18]
MSPTGLSLKIVTSLREISAADWDACANPLCQTERCTLPGTSVGERYNPFISYDFLYSLETSKSVGGRSGWTPAHIIVEDGTGALVGACPTYLKSHSYGEYVFDHGFAEAYERVGGSYYPKLLVAVPFTPVTGRRLLVRPHPESARIEAALISGLHALQAKTKASSIHVTFLEQREWQALTAHDFLPRTGQQFHFNNDGYVSFDDFLARLSSRKRKMIRKERKEALQAGITVHWLTAADIRKEHWDAFFAFYMDTGSRKWGSPYLTRAFFTDVGARMADRILLVMAKRDGRWIAGAINFIGDDALYGRNWGTIEDHPFLHFEVCYYQAIDFAISRKLQRVEAGAQGEHKLARGYMPVTTYSVHDFAHPGLKRAVADYLLHERTQVAQNIEIYAEHAPFKILQNEPQQDGND